jgi:hypothetical protein
MIFVIFIQSGTERVELARYRLSNVENIKQILSRIFEEQKQWSEMTSTLQKTWKYEIVLKDNLGRKIDLMKLNDLIHSKEEILSFFGLTEESIGDILVEGIA